MSIQEIKRNIFFKDSVNAKKEGKKQMKSTNQTTTKSQMG